MSIPDPEDEPWWEREFDNGRRGICRDACEAGLARDEGYQIAIRVLEVAKRELADARGAMTVAMLKRRLLQLTRLYISEQLSRERPYYASIAWREKYHVL